MRSLDPENGADSDIEYGWFEFRNVINLFPHSTYQSYMEPYNRICIINRHHLPAERNIPWKLYMAGP